MASDPAFNLAAMGPAAELNYTAGAARSPRSRRHHPCGPATRQVQVHRRRYTGKITAADAATMNSVDTLLDKYNNNRR